MQVKVAICCQVHLYAEGLCKLLEDDDEIIVLGVADNNDDIEKLIDMGPDIVVTDIPSRKSVLHAMSGDKRKNILLVNSDFTTLGGDNLRSMITEGIGGLLPKDSDSKVFHKAIKKLYGGELWLDRQTMREVFSGDKQVSHGINLTKKESEILVHVCEGLSNKEIANKLFISEQTVKSHCNHLFKKFGVKSRLKLAVCAPKYFPESLHS
jgi:DNA-binding NarL/FixJ family response regulator